MCGRYTQTKQFYEIRLRFDVDAFEHEISPRYNIAPNQRAVVIMSEGKRKLEMMQWCLIPSWAKDPSIGNRMINARAETLAEKPSFKRLIGKRRCLVLADGFYEWRKEGKRKVPLRIVRKDRQPFAFAGLWDSWRNPDANELHSFTIITTEANDLLRPIHDRMPVILHQTDEQLWLDPNVNDAAKLRPFLVP